MITDFKIYELKSWSDNKLKNHLNDRKELFELLSAYMEYKINDNNQITAYDFYFDKNGSFCIHYYDEDNQSKYIVKDYDELLKFLNNPELLKNSKLYNL
jgi:hypothetical protein